MNALNLRTTCPTIIKSTTTLAVQNRDKHLPYYKKGLRTGEADYKENKLGSAELSDQQLIDAMTRFPKLIERPIVLNADNAVIGRPPENVLDII